MIEAGLLEANATTQNLEVVAGLLGLLLFVAYVAEALDVWQARARFRDGRRRHSARE